MTPTARSLSLLRETGHIAGVVERSIPHANKRSDLFGFADLIAVHRVEPGALLVQATSLSNLSSRMKKATSKTALAVWLRSGGRFEVWGWYFRDDTWQVKRVAIRGEDLAAVVLEAPRRRKPDRQRGLFDALPDGDSDCATQTVNNG